MSAKLVQLRDDDRACGILVELARSLDGLAAALAGEPGAKLHRYQGEGPIAALIQNALTHLVSTLEALAAGMAKVDIWVRIADATLALLELFAESIETTATAGTELLATHGRLGEQAPKNAGSHPLLTALNVSGEGVSALSRVVTDGVSEHLPDLGDVQRVRRRLTSLLGQAPASSDAAPHIPPPTPDMSQVKAIEPRSLIDLLQHVTSTTASTSASGDRHDAELARGASTPPSER